MHTITRSELKLFASLRQRKFRKENGLFLVEGEKVIDEFLQSGLTPQNIIASDDFLNEKSFIIDKFQDIMIKTSKKDMERITAFKSASPIIAVFKTWRNKYSPEIVNQNIVLVLDQIKDPGNMGTIIRTSDWYGIEHIVCVNNCVEMFNPKVVQSTMGSLSRVNLYYEDVEDAFGDIHENIAIYGALMNGNSIYDTEFHDNGYLVIGNESNGISKDIITKINTPIHIPAGKKRVHVESLNASIANAIICSELSRQGKI